MEAAHKRGPDGLILHLEDSVPQDQKGDARRQLSDSAERWAGGRICFGASKSRLRALAADLDAAVTTGVDALVLPKTDSGEWVLEITHAVSELERERNLPLERIRLLARSRRQAPDKGCRHCHRASKDGRNGAWPRRLGHCWRRPGV
ncbi:aldolase/citrate lyase family protein [Mesorhizobium sp. M0138]|uniref:aldolase/citrate lyase family protein n=1 Tax=Mesorhizobium sp. M0138 TaxID=2956891 RepID=UPI003338C7B0